MSAMTIEREMGESPRPGTAAIWLAATRPKTLAAGATPVAVGVAIAADGGPISWGLATLCLLGALSLQLLSNLANDLFDHLHGADTALRLGPPRATASGWVTPREMGWATTAMGAVAIAIGAALVAQAGWPIVVIGLSGVICAVAYTAGPRPLGYMGLGDPLVFLFFGPAAVCGTVFVLRASVSPAAWFASVPMGLLATAILVVNNLRDREEDARTGKRTLAVRLGEEGARLQFMVLVATAYALPIMAVLRFGFDSGWLVPLATLPMALLRVRSVREKTGSALNDELSATAKLLAAYGACLSLGVLL